jgi:hypothetical protein
MCQYQAFELHQSLQYCICCTDVVNPLLSCAVLVTACRDLNT